MSLTRAICRDWGYIFNASDLHASTRQCTQGTLRAWTWSLALGATCGPQLDVQCSDAQLLATCGHILGRQHGCIWRGLVTICLHFHATGDTDERFTPRDICDMDEGVVKGREDVCNAKDHFAFPNLWAQGHGLDRCFHFWCHF